MSTGQTPGSSLGAPTALGGATASSPPADDDLISKHLQRLAEVMVAFGDEILDTVQRSKQIDVSDLRESLLGPLRARAQPNPPSTGP